MWFYKNIGKRDKRHSIQTEIKVPCDADLEYVAVTI